MCLFLSLSCVTRVTRKKIPRARQYRVVVMQPPRRSGRRSRPFEFVASLLFLIGCFFSFLFLSFFLVFFCVVALLLLPVSELFSKIPDDDAVICYGFAVTPWRSVSPSTLLSIQLKQQQQLQQQVLLQRYQAQQQQLAHQHEQQMQVSPPTSTFSFFFPLITFEIFLFWFWFWFSR